ncbi:MAG: serine hydrolase, partial [Bacteroidota bacterium]
MNLFRLLLPITALVLLGCGANKDSVNYHSQPEVNLSNILNEAMNDEQVDAVGVSLTVISPKLGIDFSGAAGYDGMDKERLLKANQPFRIASLTKTFVAAAILRLQEKNLLSIEDPISKYISKEHMEILKKGGYDPDRISIRHCLMHTSGLFDYAEGNEDYIAQASKNPLKRWTRTEQIQFAMDHGGPMGMPGENYHYSDTGYVLLGEIIEKQTNLGLAEGLRSLLDFEKLGMDSTWLESLEDRPEGLPLSVKRYMGDVDASGFDNSVDLYGGGGLSSTTRDLGIFLQALFNEEVYENSDTLEIMLLKADYNSKEQGLPDYRLGLGQIQSKRSNREAFMHSGFWGT